MHKCMTRLDDDRNGKPGHVSLPYWTTTPDCPPMSPNNTCHCHTTTLYMLWRKKNWYQQNCRSASYIVISCPHWCHTHTHTNFGKCLRTSTMSTRTEHRRREWRRMIVDDDNEPVPILTRSCTNSIGTLGFLSFSLSPI